MINRIYFILYRILDDISPNIGLKFIVPVNIGASLGLFFIAFTMVIFDLFGLNMDIVKSINFMNILLISFIIISLAYFLSQKYHKNVDLKMPLKFRMILPLLVYCIVTIVFPFIVLFHYGKG